MTIETTITRQYKIQLSFENYRADHNYQRGTLHFLKLRDNKEYKNLAEAIAEADKLYAAKGNLSWSAYWIQEVVVTETLNTDVAKRTIFTTEMVTQNDAHVVYRTAEDYNAHVTKPTAARAAARIASGEAALEAASNAEYAENLRRAERFEPLVHTAEKAYYEFKGWTVRVYPDEEEKKDFYSRLKKVVGIS